MNLFATVKSWFGPTDTLTDVSEADLRRADPRRGPGGTLAASLTAGLNNADLGDHFAYTNSLSARAALSSDVRRKIRERFRFERTQNSFLAGMVQSAANYAIGTGPRLQMMTDDRQKNREIETAFAWWARKIKLAEKLRTCVMSKIEGESFGVMTANPWVRQQTGISLDFIPLEADQVEYQPWSVAFEDDGGGGIRYDAWDNPVFYPVQKAHPGDNKSFSASIHTEPDWVEREFMCHFFRVDRPGQRRGVCEWLSALPLFALYRRMTLAVLGNIENSANMSGVLESDAEFDADGNPANPFDNEDWFLSFPVVRRMLMTLPAGAKLKPWSAAQPSSQYDTFCRSLLREIARCTGQPYGVAAGDSSEYNYASVRKDDQGWHLNNRVERDSFEQEGVDRIFERWLRVFLSQRTGMAPEDHDLSLYPHNWFWEGLEHVDPNKEASAADTRIRNGTSTRGIEYAKQGRDVDDIDERAAAEMGFEGPTALRDYRVWLRDNMSTAKSAAADDDDAANDERGRGPATSSRTTARSGGVA
ncbi:MAG: phage portal protein [Fuerstiella sp.]